LQTDEHQLIGSNFATYFSEIIRSPQPDWQYFLQKVSEQKNEHVFRALKYIDKGKPATASQYFDIHLKAIVVNGILSHLIVAITEVTDKIEEKDLLIKKDKFLNETQRVSRNGTWEIDLKTNHIIWSDVMREIHEID